MRKHIFRVTVSLFRVQETCLVAANVGLSGRGAANSAPQIGFEDSRGHLLADERKGNREKGWERERRKGAENTPRNKYYWLRP